MAFVQRADVTPKKPEGAAQHVALFKNVLVAADGGTSAKLHVYDVRDWSVKQVIRVGQVAEAAPRRGDDDGDDDDASRSGAPAPASVSALAFDGMTIAAGTHQGYVHTWKLMEHEGKRGYVRLLNPLKVDSLPVTKVHLSTDAQLLSAYSPTKRTLVVWELITVWAGSRRPTRSSFPAPALLITQLFESAAAVFFLSFFIALPAHRIAARVVVGRKRPGWSHVRRL